jgi:CRISP-associated protein Cas1
MLLGRLGLDKARIPHADRHGLIWLDRGRLEVEDGCLRFTTAGGALEAGDYQIPHQAVSMVLLGPGASVTHDALRLLANHGAALVAVGEGGVRMYTAPPLMPDTSALARQQMTKWAKQQSRMAVARRMYAIRLGEVVPSQSIEMLRGIEGARVKETYKLMAQRFGIDWRGRRYDRANPDATDLPNQAINHAATTVQAATAIAVTATATIPQLGFVHEDSGQAFVLDIADLFRDELTLSIAFGAAKEAEESKDTVDRIVRRRAAKAFAEKQVIPAMIERIRQVLGAEDGA